jgi:3-methyladenine DNA glycosylase AlkD
MSLSAPAAKIVAKFVDRPKMGDIRKCAKQINQDHDLALELWSTGQYHPRLVSTLIFDKKRLTEPVIVQLAADLLVHSQRERDQIGDWLFANQLTKDKRLIALIENWRQHPSQTLRRWFWYYQARLRWTGRTPPPENSAQLLDAVEADISSEKPEVQWAMNFCAGWIGVFESKLRSRCIKIGKKLGLYKDQVVAKNCTPSYLPEFIRIEVAKRE